MQISTELYIHGMWKSRPETLESCRNRVLRTFRELGRLSEYWRKWWRPYRSVAEWRTREVDVFNDNPQLVEQQLEAGQVVNDDGAVLKTLGYRLTAFSGTPGKTRFEFSEFTVSCCRTTKSAGPNVLSLKLPTRGPAAELVNDVQLLCETVARLSTIWLPDWLSVHDFDNLLINPPWVNGPMIGWINYLSPSVASVKQLPDGWTWCDCGEEQVAVFQFVDGPPHIGSSAHRESFRRLLQCVDWHDPESFTRA